MNLNGILESLDKVFSPPNRDAQGGYWVRPPTKRDLAAVANTGVKTDVQRQPPANLNRIKAEVKGASTVAPRIDFNGYTQESGTPIPTPPRELANLFFKYFGNEKEATPAAAVAYSESGYRPNAIGAVNSNGTTDYGLMQVNSGTFDGLKKRRPQEMSAIGINESTPYDALLDPETNLRVAKLVRKDENWARDAGYNSEPFGQWYGWKPAPFGRGINLQEMINKYK